MKEYLDIGSSGQTKFKVSKTSKAEYLIREKEYEKALTETEKLLKDEINHENLNLKGIVLNKLKQYEDSVNVFRKALSFSDSDEVKVNLANALYDWAKVSYFPDTEYEKALKLINNALCELPSGEDPSEFYFLKAEIYESQGDFVNSKINYLKAYKEFDKADEIKSQSEYLKNSDDILINITGCNFYDFTPKNGIAVDLIKQYDNEHDPDAVAVEFDGELVGYVANSDYTLIDEVKSASYIKNIIKDNQKAEIQFIYLEQYVIAKLI